MGIVNGPVISNKKLKVKEEDNTLQKFNKEDSINSVEFISHNNNHDVYNIKSSIKKHRQ